MQYKERIRLPLNLDMTIENKVLILYVISFSPLPPLLVMVFFRDIDLSEPPGRVVTELTNKMLKAL